MRRPGRSLLAGDSNTSAEIGRLQASSYSGGALARTGPVPVLLIFAFALLATATHVHAAGPRRMFRLDEGWRTIAAETGSDAGAGFEQTNFDDSNWRTVEVPHNWDDYDGFRQTRHGNRHGTAWYRRVFELSPADLADGRRVFLFFEGVGSYATVWVNGQRVGTHAGGLTTFTLDVTAAVRADAPNLLAVRADHPAGIRDLPWVCGGCEQAYGFSEGSQPLGIFRPVHVVVTAPVRIAPFGVHVWNDAPVDVSDAVLHVRTDVTNHDRAPRAVVLATRLLDQRGEVVAAVNDPLTLAAGQSLTVAQKLRLRVPAHLWSPDDPYRYTVQSDVIDTSGRKAAASPGGTAQDQQTRQTPVETQDARPGEALLDRVETPYGIRWIAWPDRNGPPGQPFRVNGEPVFINGVADYEHLLGGSHAFSDAQVSARARQIEAAGFNAFRDAHHPHNLRFNERWDAHGLLWWTQFGAHIWFENDTFKANYKQLLRDWVRERRNSPSLVLWGLQNESKLPTDFAAECAAIIRELDPTASSQRLIVTCNGGSGTDWDVPQNWSGTYGGDPLKYADELREQRLVGEYGAWRSLGLHAEPANVDAGVAEVDAASPEVPQSPAADRPFGTFAAHADGPLSEERMTALLETKVRLAATVRDAVAGHFMWPFTTHANPGRNFGGRGEQLFDGIRELDRIGPANNKGLFTIWGEPVDAYHMYRANHAVPDGRVQVPGENQNHQDASALRARTPTVSGPMVYIVSHTWPDRWTAPGSGRTIIAYSNCDEVELFNDLGTRSLGVRRRGATGTHFTWRDVTIEHHVLYAEGRIDGRTVATDITLLHHLPAAPAYEEHNAAEPAVAPLPGARTYLHRVNCGGSEYVDANGNVWSADRSLVAVDAHPEAARAAAGSQSSSSAAGNAASLESPPFFSRSWAHRYPHLPPTFGSQRRITDPVSGTRDDALFQTFRYGRNELRYIFAVPDGEYDIELFFIEPWYLAGGGADCTGWRLFDVAVNGETKLRDLDLWREAGRAHAVRKVVKASAHDGRIEISFPRVRAGQAVISAIAISTTRVDTAVSAVPDMDAPPSRPAHRRASPRSGPADSSPLISDLVVLDAANAAHYAARTHLDNGDRARGDAPGTFSGLPYALLEADWIQTAAASRSFAGTELLHFRVTRPCDVFVAADAARAEPPAWLATWARTTMNVVIAGKPNAELTVFRRRFAANERVRFGAPAPGTRMYSVFAKPALPPANATVIRELHAPAAWRAAGNLRAGQQPHADRAAIFTEVPPALSDADWIRTAHALPPTQAHGEIASFTVSDHAEVYVALDARTGVRPPWMADWIETDLKIRLATGDLEAGRMKLWKRRFAPGATVRLGPNGTLPDGSAAVMYSVIVRAVRPALTFPRQRRAENVVEWEITVGVGDRYGLNFAYRSTAAVHEPVPAEMAIVNPDGTIFCTRALGFAPTGGDERILRTRTCESINAGTYRIRLSGAAIAELEFGSLQVE